MSIKKSRVVLVLLVALLVIVPLRGLLAQEQVTLRVLNYLDLTSPGTEREIKEIWEAFEKNNPDIKIEREDLYGEPFHQKLEAYAAAGNLPDVMYMWPGARSATLHDKKLVKDLTPFLGDEINDFVPAAVDPNKQRGKYLAMIPIGITASHMLYANQEMLNDLGLNMPEVYDELKTMVPKLQEAGKDVVIMGAQDDWVIQSVLFSMLVGRLAGDAFIDKILAGEAKFTDEPFVSTLKFYQQLFDDGVLTPDIVMTPYGTSPALFAAGEAPFTIDGDWRVGAFLTDPTTGEALIPPDEQDKILLTIFPAIPGEVTPNSTSMVLATGFGMSAAIPDGSPKEEAAWRLISWLVSPEVQKIRLETGAAIPSRKGITAEGLEPLVEQRLRFYEKYVGTYVLDDVLPPEAYMPINVGLQEIALGMSTPEDVAATVQKGYEEWMAGLE